MLHFCEGFRGFDYATQTLVVKLVGGGPSRASAEDRTDGDYMVFVLNILVDDVVGKTRESESAARNEHLDLIGGREFSDAIEDVGGLFLCQASRILLFSVPLW